MRAACWYRMELRKCMFVLREFAGLIIYATVARGG